MGDYLSFNGSTQAIKLASRSGAWFPSTSGVSATIKFKFTNGTTRGILWTDRVVGGSSTEYYLDINNTGHLTRVQFAAFDGTNGFNVYSDNALNDGQWHVVTVVKAATNSHYWYIDGVLQASQPGSTTVTARTYADNRYLGAYSNATLKYTGDIAWLAIHDKALSGAEIQAIHSGGSVWVPTGTTCDYYSGGPAGASSWGGENTQRQIGLMGTNGAITYSSSVVPTAVSVDGRNDNLFPATFNKIKTLYRTARIIAPGTGGATDERIREIGNCYIASDGLYVITYAGHSIAGTSTTPQVHYATSPDGITWTKQGLMLDKTVVGFYTEDPYVYRDPDTGTYWLMCENRDTTPGQVQAGIAVFSSSNGKTSWTLQSSNCLAFGSAGTFDSQDNSSPVFWKEGSSWYLIFEGRQGTPGGAVDNGSLGVAISSTTPAGPWTKVSNSPVYAHSGTGDWKDGSIVPDEIQKFGGTYYLICHGFGFVSAVQGYRCGMIQSTDLINWSETPNLAPMEGVFVNTLMKSAVAFHHLYGVAESGANQYSILRFEALGTENVGFDENFTASGSVTLNGLADGSMGLVGSGGAVAAGSAINTLSSTILSGSGGARPGGSVFIDYRQLYSGTGGARVGSTAVRTYRANVVGLGGLRLGGSAVVTEVDATPASTPTPTTTTTRQGFTCKVGNSRVVFHSVLVKKAYVPAITICHLYGRRSIG
jgi:hypothetical protein